MRTQNNQKRLIYICQAGLIAALYTVLTIAVGAVGLASGAIQFRISEALCVLPFFTPAAIPARNGRWTHSPAFPTNSNTN